MTTADLELEGAAPPLPLQHQQHKVTHRAIRALAEADEHTSAGSKAAAAAKSSKKHGKKRTKQAAHAEQAQASASAAAAAAEAEAEAAATETVLDADLAAVHGLNLELDDPLVFDPQELKLRAGGDSSAEHAQQRPRDAGKKRSRRERHALAAASGSEVDEQPPTKKGKHKKRRHDAQSDAGGPRGASEDISDAGASRGVRGVSINMGTEPTADAADGEPPSAGPATSAAEHASGRVPVGQLTSGGWSSNAVMARWKAEGRIDYDEGYFSQAEDDILTDGVTQFLEVNHLGETFLHKLLWKKSKEVANDPAFAEQKTAFWDRMNVLLPRRQLRSIWHHLRTLYSPHRKESGGQGWTPEMGKRIIELVEQHGPDWRSFVDEIGRTAQCIRDRYRLLRKRADKNGEVLPAVPDEHARAPRTKAVASSSSSSSSPSSSAVPSLTFPPLAPGPPSQPSQPQPQRMKGSKKRAPAAAPASVSATASVGNGFTELDAFRLVTRLGRQVDETDAELESAVDWEALRDEHWGAAFSGAQLRAHWGDVVRSKFRGSKSASFPAKLADLRVRVKLPALTPDVIDDDRC